jgi:glutamate formiminotransferase
VGEPVILEAVPNYSEGRDRRTVDAITAAVESKGAVVADVHLDDDHHRCVVTAFGTHDQLLHGLVESVFVAVEHIDLSRHTGAHPRIGACDVLPIVPMESLHPRGGDARHASVLANEVALHVGPELELPVVRYGAGIAGHAFAGQARAGGSNALAARLAAGEVVPIAGPAHLHPTAGAVLVGVRDVLVAFNVNLVVADGNWLPVQAAAKAICAQVRERGGGLPGVRALPFNLHGPQLVQVSTNVERWQQAGPVDVLEHVMQGAEALGVEVAGCELVGLAPAAALEALEGRCEALGVALAAAPGAAIERHLERAVAQQ